MAEVPYLANDEFSTTEESYYNLLGEINDGIEATSPVQQQPLNSAAILNRSVTDTGSTEFKLPRIELPYFDGDYNVEQMQNLWKKFSPSSKLPSLVGNDRRSTYELHTIKKLCKNCFAFSHVAFNCKSQRRCDKCSKKHNTLLHESFVESSSPPAPRLKSSAIATNNASTVSSPASGITSSTNHVSSIFKPKLN